MTTSDYIQMFLSIFTLLAIIASIILSNRQLLNSNKQILFDRRLDVYLISEQLKKTIDQDLDILKTDSKKSNQKRFLALTNNLYLQDVQDLKDKNNFIKMREAGFLSAKSANFIFEKDSGKYISNFINDYWNVLNASINSDKNLYVVLEELQKSYEKYSNIDVQKLLVSQIKLIEIDNWFIDDSQYDKLNKK